MREQLSGGSASGARSWVWSHWRRLSWDRRRQIKYVAESATPIWAVTLIAVVVLNGMGVSLPDWLLLGTLALTAVLMMTLIFVLIPIALAQMWWTSDSRKDFWRRWKAQDGH